MIVLRPLIPACLAVLALLAGCSSAARERDVFEVARFEQDQVTGVAVSKSGRVFVSFPRWHDNHRVSVAEVLPDGSFVPWPDAPWNSWREGDPVRPDCFVCVQSVLVDASDRVWVLDPGSPRMGGVLPGAAKLVQFDLKSGAMRRAYAFTDVAAPARSYLNDLRLDVARNLAFITDSGLGALVVLDLKSGAARRVLSDNPSTKADPSVILMNAGRELRMASGPMAGRVPQVHADGIALDQKNGWVYYQALTSRTLYRVPGAALADPALTPDSLASKVEHLGPTCATDGMEIDSRGNIYFSDFENDAVKVRTPDGQMHTLVQSPLLSWPDSFAIGPAPGGGARGWLYLTCAQIHLTDWFMGPGNMPSTPYRVFRTGLFDR